jgi:signal transduction histidine kinase
LNLQESILHSQKIAIEKRYDTKGFVQGFPMELKQVLLNLVSNAIQAMPDGGRLRVSVGQTAASSIRVCISDSGCGISNEDAKRLFEPFFTTKSTKGTGLGLWISRGIIQKHDGTLKFRSTSFPSGSATCFQISLPSSDLPAS